MIKFNNENYTTFNSLKYGDCYKINNLDTFYMKVKAFGGSNALLLNSGEIFNHEKNKIVYPVIIHAHVRSFKQC